MMVVLVVAGGVALGGFGVAGDVFGVRLWSHSGPSLPEVLGYLTLLMIGNAAGFWALAAVVIGFVASARSTLNAIISSTAFLLVAVGSYYAINLWVGERAMSGQLVAAFALWSGVALVVGPATGLLGAWARRATGSRRPLAALGILALLVADLLLVVRAAGDAYPLGVAMLMAGYALVVGLAVLVAMSQPRRAAVARER